MADLSRRQFLFVCGAAAASLWLPKAGRVELPQRMVTFLAGTCSFCGKTTGEVAEIVGVIGRPCRICNDCLGLCLEIIAEENERDGGRPPPPSRQLTPGERATLAEVHVIVATLGMHPGPEMLERVRQLMAGLPPDAHRRPKDACSFCEVTRREVGRLISGPRVFICDGCITEGVAISRHVVPPSPRASLHARGRRVTILNGLEDDAET